MEHNSERKTDKNLNSDYWDTQYKNSQTGWDMGTVSPPLKEYIDQLKDKNCSILIPGCGNTYEAEYLLKQGFTNITVIDFAPTLVDVLKEKFKGNKHIRIVLSDFFEHQGQYDLVLEQTFFCALNPELREKYCSKMHALLAPGGKLAGLFFNKEFEKEGPPFGGSKSEYEKLFSSRFELSVLETCHNSHPKRADSELFFVFKKK